MLLPTNVAGLCMGAQPPSGTPPEWLEPGRPPLVAASDADVQRVVAWWGKQRMFGFAMELQPRAGRTHAGTPKLPGPPAKVPQHGMRLLFCDCACLLLYHAMPSVQVHVPPWTSMLSKSVALPLHGPRGSRPTRSQGCMLPTSRCAITKTPSDGGRCCLRSYNRRPLSRLCVQLVLTWLVKCLSLISMTTGDMEPQATTERAPVC